MIYTVRMLPSSFCTCVLLCKYWTLSYITWRIFHSDTFSQFIPSPSFCYIIHKIAIWFRHWSSWATPGAPASDLYSQDMWKLSQVGKVKDSVYFHTTKAGNWTTFLGHVASTPVTVLLHNLTYNHLHWLSRICHKMLNDLVGFWKDLFNETPPILWKSILTLTGNEWCCVGCKS